MDFEWEFSMPPEGFEAADLSPHHLLFVMGAFHRHEEDLGYDGRTYRKPLAYNHICAIIKYALRNDLGYPMNEEHWPEHPFLNAATARDSFLDHFDEVEEWTIMHRDNKRKISIALDKIREEGHSLVHTRTKRSGTKKKNAFTVSTESSCQCAKRLLWPPQQRDFSSFSFFSMPFRQTPSLVNKHK